jgi:hypothetical protein
MNGMKTTRKLLALAFALGLPLSLTACGDSGTSDTKQQQEPRALPDARDGVVTDRFARMALSCIHREYPNKISHVLNGDGDVGAPRELTPAFYGCFDWHSSVHGHWLLVRLMKTDPASPFVPVIREALAESFTPDKLAGELAYYSAEGRKSFERPYGIAWFLQLVAELQESDDPDHKAWRQTLRPLEQAIVARVSDWLPKLAYPVRLGTHNQTAFAFGLMLDYARTVDNPSFAALLRSKIMEFHAADRNCPIGYEPSGEDFLSPCLMEADLMRRVMRGEDYATWLMHFLPAIPVNGRANWLKPALVRDATDGKLVHLDGVNLSRAWALEGIAGALAADDPRRDALLAAAKVHKETGISAVSDEHYAGSHWLASFATYLETKRGL